MILLNGLRLSLLLAGRKQFIFQRRLLQTLQSHTTFQLVVKKSKFIAHAKSVTSKEEALSFVEEVKEAKATHNCFAYKVGVDERASDDGEVSGTAGKQILSAIQNCDLENVVVVVIRFYGGVKLGTGGLTRAYSGVTLSCLQQATVIDFVPSRHVSCSVLLSSLGGFYHLLSGVGGGGIVAEEYHTDHVAVKLRLPEDKLDAFHKAFDAQFTRNSEGQLTDTDVACDGASRGKSKERR